MTDLKCDLAAVKSLQFDCEEVRRQAKVEVAREQLRLLECKICRDTPTRPVVLVMCCKQLLGCEACFRNFMEENECCPLRRDQTQKALLWRVYMASTPSSNGVLKKCDSSSHSLDLYYYRHYI